MAFEFDYEFTDIYGDKLTIIDWSALNERFLTVRSPNAVSMSESAARVLANFLLRWADGNKE